MGTWKVRSKYIRDRCRGEKRSFLAKGMSLRKINICPWPSNMFVRSWAPHLQHSWWLHVPVMVLILQMSDHIDLHMGWVGAVDVQSIRNKWFQINSANVLLSTNKRKKCMISRLYFAINTAFISAPIYWCILKSYCCVLVAQGMRCSFHEGCRES